MNPSIYRVRVKIRQIVANKFEQKYPLKKENISVLTSHTSPLQRISAHHLPPYCTFNFFCKPSHAKNTRLKCRKHATFWYIQPYIIPFHTYIVPNTNKYKKIQTETNRRVPQNHCNACNQCVFSLSFPIPSVFTCYPVAYRLLTLFYTRKHTRK